MSSEGLTADPLKTQGLQDFPIPTTKQQVQRFLGSVNFHSEFIPNYSIIAAPLYKYTSSEYNNLTLDQPAIDAFNALKEAVMKPVRLNLVDPTKPIYLEVDASNIGYGGTIYQIQTFNKSDMATIKQEMMDKQNKSNEELDEEMKKVIKAYVSGEPIPDYSIPEVENPVTEDPLKSPFIASEVKPKSKGQLFYLPKIISFFSKKFTDDQIRNWSSLTKETLALLDAVEKKADILYLAKECVLISDCNVLVFLHSQRKSNSLMSRYLARLNHYPFKVIVKHKPGKHLAIADGLSRCYVLQAPETPRINHNNGALIVVPFKPGSVLTSQELASAVDNWAGKQLVTDLTSVSISKYTQTEILSDTVNNIVATIPETTRMNEASLSRLMKSEIDKLLTMQNYMDEQTLQFPELMSNLSSLKEGEEATYNFRYNAQFTNKLARELFENRLNNKTFKMHSGLIHIKNPKDRFVRLTPDILRATVLSRIHVLGHCGTNKLIAIVGNQEYWPGFTRSIQTFCRSCLICSQMNPLFDPQFKLGIPITGEVGEVIYMDIVSGLPHTKSQAFFASCICAASRFAYTFTLSREVSEYIVLNLKKLFAVLGTPRYIVCDGASNLGKAKIIREACYLHGVKIHIRTAYSSKSLGLVERCHSSILQNTRKLIATLQSNWVDVLPLATLLYNITPHRATGISPYELMFGRKGRLFNILEEYEPEKKDPTHICDPLAPDRVLLGLSEQEKYDEIRKTLAELQETAKKRDQEYKRKFREKLPVSRVKLERGMIVTVRDKRPIDPTSDEKEKLRDKFTGIYVIDKDFGATVLLKNLSSGHCVKTHKDFVKVIADKSDPLFKDLPKFAEQVMGKRYENRRITGLSQETIEKIFRGQAALKGIPYGTEDLGDIAAPHGTTEKAKPKEKKSEPTPSTPDPLGEFDIEDEIDHYYTRPEEEEEPENRLETIEEVEEQLEQNPTDNTASTSPISKPLFQSLKSLDKTTPHGYDPNGVDQPRRAQTRPRNPDLKYTQ